MHRYYKREDGVEVNIFYCDKEDCMNRKFVTFNPPTEEGLKAVPDWGTIYLEYPDGSKEIKSMLCPRHYKKYQNKL